MASLKKILLSPLFYFLIGVGVSGTYVVDKHLTEKKINNIEQITLNNQENIKDIENDLEYGKKREQITLNNEEKIKEIKDNLKYRRKIYSYISGGAIFLFLIGAMGQSIYSRHKNKENY